MQSTAALHGRLFYCLEPDMTLHEMRQLVLDSRSDTLMAQRFREAFGIRGRQERNAKTITRRDMDARIARREVMRLMSQRYGALDRSDAR